MVFTANRFEPAGVMDYYVWGTMLKRYYKHSRSLWRLMSWKSPCCHKNTSTRRWRTSLSAWLSAFVLMVITTSFSSTRFLHLYVQFIYLLRSNESWGELASCFQIYRLLDPHFCESCVIVFNLRDCFPALTDTDYRSYMLMVCHNRRMKNIPSINSRRVWVQDSWPVNENLYSQDRIHPVA